MSSYGWRILISTILTILLVWIAGATFPSSPSSTMLSELFWTNKAYPNQQYDMVFIGDSRIYRGIDPDTIARKLQPYAPFRVFNFGFSSAGLDTALMDAGAALLDSSSKRRVIVLGVTPSALADENLVNTHFHQEKNRPTTELWQRRYINPYFSYFDPTTPVLFRNAYRGHQEGYFQEYKMNGWIASTKVPANVWEDFWMVEQGFKKAVFSLAVRKKLIQKIAEWTKQGIQVFAFRPPAVKHFEEVEDKLSGISQTALIAQIEAVGGTWIDIPDRYNYITYDGNHLEKPSALRLSAFLGESIKNSLQEKTTPSTKLIWADYQNFETKFSNPWQNVLDDAFVQTSPYSGVTVYQLAPQAFSCTYLQNLDSLMNQNLYIHATCWTKAENFKKEAQISLVISIENNGEALFWQGGQFGEQALDFATWNRLGNKANYANNKAGSVLKIYVWNNSDSRVLIDDFQIKVEQK